MKPLNPSLIFQQIDGHDFTRAAGQYYYNTKTKELFFAAAGRDDGYTVTGPFTSKEEAFDGAPTIDAKLLKTLAEYDRENEGGAS